MIVINPFTVAAPAPVAWNPADKGTAITLSNGNLTATGTITVRATANASGGKKYYEAEWAGASTGNQPRIGIADNDATLLDSNRIGSIAGSYGLNSGGFFFLNGGTPIPSGPTFTVGDIIGVAIDLNAGDIWWALNGTWLFSGDPATGLVPAVSGIPSLVYYPAICPEDTHDWTGHFSLADFVYTPPTGFVPW